MKSLGPRSTAAMTDGADPGRHPGVLQALDELTCLELLAGVEIGRVGVTVAALPAIFPVAYRLIDGRIMFYTGAGSKLTAALSETVVAFEADSAEPATRSGWSVLVVGIARLSTSEADHAAAAGADLRPWAAGDRPHLVTILPERVSGRRLLGAPAPAATDPN